jgi:lipopolysaccharide biosynthesis glycosyltransferase
MEMVYYVDGTYPHAFVEENGSWYADDNPKYRPIVRARNPHQTVVAFSSDQSYFPGLLPAVLSLQQHHPEIPIVVIDCGLTPHQVRYLQQFAEVFTSTHQLPDIPAWARFDVSLLNYDRVVYLDSDIIVLRKIPSLLETDAPFAAVKNLDWSVKENFKDPRVLDRYNIDPETPAFFGGGFSIDNRLWGNGKLAREAMRVYNDVGWSFVYADQSALQIMMYSEGNGVTYLEDEYNAIAECWDWESKSDKARVIHYAGDEIKPWNPLCKYPKLQYFFNYSKIKRL